MFDNIIGQDKAKKRLKFFTQAANQVSENGKSLQNLFEPVILLAPKGCGKTEMARQVCANLKDNQGNPRTVLDEINGANLKSAKDFTQLLQRMDEHEYCAVLIDEAHEMSKDIQTRLLTTFNVEDKAERYFSYKDEHYCINIKKHAFIFATTNPEKFLDPLMNRLRDVHLERYKDEEVLKIAHFMAESKDLGDDKVDQKALNMLALQSRNSPRDCRQLVEELSCLQSIYDKKITMQDWVDHVYSQGMLPLGIKRGELDVLRSVSKHADGVQLSTISGEVGLDSKTISGALEPFLFNRKWIRKDNKRYITKSGKKVLAYIESELEKV